MSKTQRVRNLVREVLSTIPEPYGEDVIEDVFLAIEYRADWSEIYGELAAELTKHVVNPWIGRYSKEFTGLQSGPHVAATRSQLIGSYTKLLL